MALLVRQPDGAIADPRAIGSAGRTCLELLTADGPLIVAIDDLQWLDEPTVGALEFALRRSHGLPVRLLATVRSDPDRSVEIADHRLLLALPRDAVTVSVVRGVSLGAMGHLLRDRLGQPVSRPALVGLQGASAGNPLLALELARASIERTGGLRTLDQPTLSRDLDRLLGERIGGLPLPTRRMLTMVAIDGQPTVGRLKATSGLDPRRVLAPAVDAGILTIGPAAVQFDHPMYAAAAYGRATAADRTAAHRALARITLDPVQLARHEALGTTRPSRQSAAVVERGAVLANVRGAPATGAELMTHARRLTPASADSDRWRRTTAESLLRWDAGQPTEARSLLELALPHLAAGRERSEAMLQLAIEVEWAAGGEAAEVVLRDALRARPIDADIEAGIRLRLATITQRPLTAARQATLAAARLMPLADRLDDLRACAALVRAEACLRLGAGWNEAEVRTAERLLHDARDRPPSLMTLPAWRIAEERSWILATMRDELSTARRMMSVIEERIGQLGWERAQTILLAELSIVETWLGELDAAALHARSSLELAEQTGSIPYAHAEALLASAQVAAAQGDLDDARRLVGQAFVHRPAEVDPWNAARLYAVLGSIELMAGRPREALEALEAVARIVAVSGQREPADLRYEGDHLEAALAVGRVDRADAILADLEARRRIADRPWLGVMVARGRALLAAADGDPKGALVELVREPEVHDRLEMPLERGRTLLLEGRLRRRAREKRAARGAFEAAARLFETAGARGLAATATAESARVGLRPASPHELTETERRVADLAARGGTNREVGQALFLSPKSVDGVLIRVYQKLGIHSRAELGALLGATRDPDSADHPNALGSALATDDPSR